MQSTVDKQSLILVQIVQPLLMCHSIIYGIFGFVIFYFILTWKGAKKKTTFILKWIMRKSIETQQKLKWLKIVRINLSVIEILLFSLEQLKQLSWGVQGKLTPKPQKASKKPTVVLSLSNYQNAHSINAP